MKPEPKPAALLFACDPVQTRLVSQALVGTRARDFALHITHKISDALRHTCASSVNASIGVSTYPGDGQDVETLIHKADSAMYDAKKLGRNNYQFFRADMQARVLEWQSLEGNLRSALGRNEFMLHYQPKIDLKTAAVSGAEALIAGNIPNAA